MTDDYLDDSFERGCEHEQEKIWEEVCRRNYNMLRKKDLYKIIFEEG